jgi:hypothetical protein
MLSHSIVNGIYSNDWVVPGKGHLLLSKEVLTLDIYEEFEDTEEVVRIQKSKKRTYS